MIIKFTVFSFVLIAKLSVSRGDADDYHCGSMEIQPCTVKGKWHHAEGFRCETTHGADCLIRDAWCNVGRNYLDKNRCTKSENLMFDTCLSVEKTIDGRIYHANIAKVDWVVAEQYCQMKDMNLVSFEDQQEYDKVIDFLRSVSSHPDKLATRSDVTYEDKLAQRCWGVNHGYGAAAIYWTGLLYDPSARGWNYSDGSTINLSVMAGREMLNDALRRHNPFMHVNHIGIWDKNFEFVVSQSRKDRRHVNSQSSRAGILCKMGSNRKWNGGLPTQNSGCLTGFKCKGRIPNCITGSVFQNSQVCDGVADCPEVDDEGFHDCFLEAQQFPDKRRYAYFSPFKKNFTIARRLCESHNLTLPSVHSKEDIEFLRSLPRLFAGSRKSPDFLIISENWKTLSWKILLGVHRDSDLWQDGSPVEYRKYEIVDLPSDSDVYLEFDNSVGGRIRAIHELSEDIFPVCQGRRYDSKLVPIIVPLTKAHDSWGSKRSFIDFVVITILIMATF